MTQLMAASPTTWQARPRWATPRNPSRLTLGPRIGEVASLLGRPLMPWQQDAADVALELDPDTGRLWYHSVRLVVPRQQGKTELELAVAVHRANAWPDQAITYAAQTRIKAREKWEESHVKTLNRSPFGPEGNRYTVTRANGNEAIHWRNGSRHGISAATDTSGHGDVIDLAFIDEAWAQVDNRLEQAFQPAMLTRHRPPHAGAQLWIVSTAGNQRSSYLREKVRQGRLLVQDGGPIRICYIEYSAPPGADPADPTVWAATLPALGHTMGLDAIQALYESMDLPEFRRAVLCQWPDEQPQGWEVISQQPWTSLGHQDAGLNQPTGNLALAADVNPERSYGALGIAGPSNHQGPYTVRGDDLGTGTPGEGPIHVEVIDYRAGTAWMVPAIADFVRTWRPRLIVLDPAGPAGSLVPDLQRELGNAFERVKLVNLREAAQAAQGFYDAVVDHRSISHRNQPPLDLALAGARKRVIGDAWLWARKNLAVDVCPLVAVSLARWGWLVAPTPEQDYDPLRSVF